MTPVVESVLGGYEAATYDERTHVDFWRYSAGKWHEQAARIYPLDAGDGTGANEQGVTLTGGVLTGMSHATFIIDGRFTGDGTGYTVVYGDGPSGWGYLPVVANASSMISTGKSAKSNADNGIFFGASFVNGQLQVGIDTGVFSDAFAGGVPIVQMWRGNDLSYTLVNDNIFTAATAPTPQYPAAPLPSSTPPDGTYGGLISQMTLGGNSPAAVRVTLAVQPGAVTQECVDTGSCSSSQSTAISVLAKPQTMTVIPVALDQGYGYITGPVWAIAGLYPNLGVTYDLFQKPSEFAQRGDFPWYIPSSLGVASFNLYQGEPAQLTFKGGQVSEVQLG